MKRRYPIKEEWSIWESPRKQPNELKKEFKSKRGHDTMSYRLDTLCSSFFIERENFEKTYDLISEHDESWPWENGKEALIRADGFIDKMREWGFEMNRYYLNNKNPECVNIVGVTFVGDRYHEEYDLIFDSLTPYVGKESWILFSKENFGIFAYYYGENGFEVIYPEIKWNHDELQSVWDDEYNISY